MPAPAVAASNPAHARKERKRTCLAFEPIPVLEIAGAYFRGLALTDTKSNTRCGWIAFGRTLPVGTGRHPSHLTSVILSEVVVREADDNAVEGPAVRSDRQQRFREFSLYRRQRENAFGIPIDAD